MNKLIIFLFFVSIDLLTKYIVKTNLVLNHPISLTVNIDLIYVQNYGVSFGLFSQTLSYWVFVLIGLIIVLFIFYLMITSNKKQEKNSYFIIIIGAMGNIIDRFFNTYVVDFISLHYNNYYWPAFNLADIYITIGIIMLLFSIFTNSKES